MSKKEEKEKRVNDILDAALELIVKKGYENTSMNEIAAKAGISKGGLYHHFLSKDHLLLYANKKIMEPVEQFMEKAISATSPIEGLSRYIEDYISYWLEHKREFSFLTITMNKAMNQRDIFKMYEKFAEEYISFFESLFASGIIKGEFRAHDTRTQAMGLMSALDGALIYMVLDKKMKLNDVTKGFKNIFLHSLSKG